MKIVSLFSGCGGLDYGFRKAGFRIVWANDFDKFAVQTYEANFGDHIVCGDINDIPVESIPPHDVLIGGFPCQPFSMMGDKLGFEDTRGTLFFNIARIIRYQIQSGHAPAAIVLENVKALRTHDHGKTFAVIKNVLREDLGYTVYDGLLNSADFGVPQTRNRTYIVALRDPAARFVFPKKIPLCETLQDRLQTDVEDKYFLSERILKTILSCGTNGYRAKCEIDLPIARPLTATMAKMHRACQDNYVTQGNRIRRLTPRECARLQGFPDDFIIPVSDFQAYKQFGNAVTVDVAYAVARAVRKALQSSSSKGSVRRPKNAAL